MKAKKVPERCKDCVHLHTGGIKNGKYDRWCSYHSKPAPDAVSHCVNVGGKQVKGL